MAARLRTARVSGCSWSKAIVSLLVETSNQSLFLHPAETWETSHIGYPTGPEVDWAPGGPVGREQSFTGGRMLWSGTFGSAAPDPVRFSERVSPSGIEAFGADVNLELHHDGTVRFHGRVVNTGANAYDYALNAVLVTEHLGLALRRSGSIPRTIPK